MSLGRYTYLPWLRRGVANAIKDAATVSSRAVVDISLAVNDGAATGAPITKSFKLMGPGDITGLIADQVIRIEPRALVTDFEPNYLAFVDFYDEDFPWLHTPAPPGSHRLTPWLTLLVLADGEFDRIRTPDLPLGSVQIKTANPANLFPPDDQLWAWAHVQISGDIAGTDTSPDAAALDTALTQAPDRGISRLICPRRLRPNTGYTAVIIPTFEVGRKTGLKQSFDDATSPGVTIAWSGGATEFPVYYEWTFRTGEEGDFEDLVERMVPRPMDPRVGIRDMDIASPGFGMPVVTPAVGPDHHKGVVGLEGALKSPSTQPKPLDAASQFPQDAAGIVNAPAVAQAAGEGDPVVAPPLYGGWHALVDRVDPAGMSTWVNDLNLDPRHRAAGGLGGRVIQARQDDYMKLAWEQVGEILAANRRVAFFRFAQRAAEKSFAKTLSALPEERFLSLTAPVFGRVLGSPQTIRGLLADSRLPEAALSPAFRKLVRPRGLNAKRALPADARAAAASRLAVAINDQQASAAPKPPPVAGPTLEQVANAVDPGQGGSTALAGRGFLILLLFLLLLLALLSVFAIGGAAGLVVAGALVAVAGGVLAALVRAPPGGAARPSLHLEALTPDQISDAPPGFALSAPSTTVPTTSPPADPVAAADFAVALKRFAGFIAARPPAKQPAPAFDMRNARAKVLAALDPVAAFPRRAAGVIRIGERSIIDYVRDAYQAPPVAVAQPRIVPVMAYPDFKDAMYRPLASLSDDLLVPNLGLVPPNTISLMLTNPPFIEAYMAGLNHEFARELLWREYPTDCRGSPFRQFWEIAGIPTPGLTEAQREARLKDITPLHTWDTASALGTHEYRASIATSAEHVVLVIRGDLLKRYPNTIIYAQDAVWSSDPQHQNELALYDEDGEKALANIADPKIHYPIFKAPVPPDLTFIGFDASLETVRGDPNLDETAQAHAKVSPSKLGWFFVLQEVVAETRFGLDEESPPPGMESAVRWDNLAWSDLTFAAGRQTIDLAAPLAHTPTGTNPNNLAWAPSAGANAADIALILRQKPVLVAIHARQMLERGKVD
jgi:hypothetical protein